jgi:hypothetical protein
MPANADLRTAITDAVALAIKPEEMVALLDKAIAAALIGEDASGAGQTAGLPAVTLSVGGHSRTLAFREAQDMRDYYARQGAGVYSQSVEFLE